MPVDKVLICQLLSILIVLIFILPQSKCARTHARTHTHTHTPLLMSEG